MHDMFEEQNPSFLRYDTNYREVFVKRMIDKINVIEHGKINNYNKDAAVSPRKVERNPTPRDVLHDYLESTSVHGLQYFGKLDIKVGKPGKILWTCTIFISFVCLSLMVIQFLRRYQENPTNTYIKTFDAPIFRAPFPAVTVCPSTPISVKRRLSVLEHIILPENVSRVHALNMLKYAHLITHPYTVTEEKDLEILKSFLRTNELNLSQFLKILIPCDDMFESCWWSTERIDCSKYIKVSHSSYGLCCSFNYQLENYVGSEEGQPRSAFLKSADFGRWSGLKLVVKNEMLSLKEEENDFMKITKTEGFMVLIHHSMDFPGLGTNMYILQADHELEIAINPSIVHKPKGLRHRNRKYQVVPVCTPEDEASLEYFPVYRFFNCYANCVVKALIQNCGCLPFTYGYIADFYNIPRCELDNADCVRQNRQSIHALKNIENDNSTCSCRTPCNDIIYGGYPNSIALRNTDSTNNSSGGTATLRVFMYFDTFQILETLPAADETYLLASIGGIFSLFLGCSFLSLVEILYFLCLYCRAICSRNRGTS